jgi:chromosome segregation protein
LRDIVDLLMGTGLGPGSYSIVSQGQIDSILTSKPTERRALFEESAGISKFLARKHESMRRLEQTEQNGIRISDLISELERRIPELETQVRRAKRYRKVSARVRDLEILSYLRASASRRREREELQKQADRNEDVRGAAAAKAATLGAQLAELRTRMYQHELHLEELRTHSQERRAELARVEAEYAAALGRREALERQSTQTSEDVARVVQERQTLDGQIASLDERIAPLLRDVEAARENELAAHNALATTRAQLDTIFTQLREVEAVASQVAALRAERRVVGENLRAEADRMERETQTARARAEQLEIAAGAAAHKHASREPDLNAREREIADQRLQLERADREVASAHDALNRATTEHRQHSGDVAAAESRLHTIEELEATLEGHVPGTRAAFEAWQRGELRGLEGIVSNLIETDERFARAMDVAFGPRLSNIVTRTSEDAERAIDYLSVKELGRATFLPLDTLANREGKAIPPELQAVPGVIGYAHTLIRTKAQYQGIIRFLVGSVLIVDTLQTGIALARGRGLRDTIVTLSGEQIAGGGAITGGRFKRERSILSRRVQATTLREQLVPMHAKLSELEHALAAAARASEEAIALRDGAREALTRSEMQLAELRAEMVALQADAERMHIDFDAARARVEELGVQAREARERERSMESGDRDGAQSDDDRHRLEAELARARAQIAHAEAGQSQATTQAGELRERLAALGAERDGARARLGIIDQDSERAHTAREQMLAEISGLMEQTRTSHAHLEGLQAGVRDTDARLEVARRERERLADATTQLESDLRLAENETRDASAGGEGLRMRLAQIEAELGMLVSQFAQNPATEDECHDVEERFKHEPDSALDDLPRLREELARLQANVNLNAEAEREEVAGREAFLRAQLDDLARARETLLQSIKEIELQTQAQFNETFDRVSVAFRDMYERLFPGGDAKMWQTNPENLSETGIEISVQPPGKKLMALPALSGGERAMVAAALIFALIQVKPSPFYLLDEVDAALDDVNVDRFSHMVRELTGNDSQMLIVTHNKKTMELADRMYGVTMSEAGVSTIVSAVLSETKAEPAFA